MITPVELFIALAPATAVAGLRSSSTMYIPVDFLPTDICPSLKINPLLAYIPVDSSPVKLIDPVAVLVNVTLLALYPSPFVSFPFSCAIPTCLF